MVSVAGGPYVLSWCHDRSIEYRRTSMEDMPPRRNLEDFYPKDAVVNYKFYVYTAVHQAKFHHTVEVLR
jgi:hypothetical protein